MIEVQGAARSGGCLLRGRSGEQPAPSLSEVNSNEHGHSCRFQSFREHKILNDGTSLRPGLSPMGLGEFRQCPGTRCFHDLNIRTGLPALRRLARQRLCGPTPEADAGGDRTV